MENICFPHPQGITRHSLTEFFHCSLGFPLLLQFSLSLLLPEFTKFIASSSSSQLRNESEQLGKPGKIAHTKSASSWFGTRFGSSVSGTNTRNKENRFWNIMNRELQCSPVLQIKRFLAHRTRLQREIGRAAVPFDESEIKHFPQEQNQEQNMVLLKGKPPLSFRLFHFLCVEQGRPRSGVKQRRIF